MKRMLAVLVGAFLLLVLLVCTGFIQPVLVLLFGWIWFLVWTLPQVRVSPAGCFQAAITLVLAAAATHSVCRWFHRRIAAARGVAAGPWRGRWTALLLIGVIVLFAAGISMAGIVHVSGWLLTADRPLLTINSGRAVARRVASANQLKQLGLAALSYHDEHGSLPAGGTFDRYGRMQHGWVAPLLPYLEIEEMRVDVRVPWDHPNNERTMKTVISILLHPALRREYERDEQGYALAHYAANGRVMGGGRGRSLDEITDGTSTTALLGEVAEGFRPWGHPLNWRDPGAGLNAPGCFGTPLEGQPVQLLMADGSVRALAADTDPAVLRAIATPAGGERVSP